MSFTNSSMVSIAKSSPNYTKPRKYLIRKITIHHTGGILSIEALGNWFSKKTTKASSNYGIGGDGRVALYVEEKNRAWTSSSPENDHQAVTYEVCNSTEAPYWKVSDKALETIIALSVDVCLRNPEIKQINGKRGLSWTGNDKGSLTIHKFFTNTNCPGPYLESKMAWIAEEVNKRLAIAFDEKQPEQNNQNGSILKEEGLEMTYNYIDNNMPEWARPTIQKLVDKGLLKGNKKGELGLNDTMLKIFVINDRAGLY
mgnify:CR=1 FL=1